MMNMQTGPRVCLGCRERIGKRVGKSGLQGKISSEESGKIWEKEERIAPIKGRKYSHIHKNCPGKASFPIDIDRGEHDVGSIERYGNLVTFRDSVKARWLEWNGKVKELQIKEKEEELAYHKVKVCEIEKEILELKNT